jgi:hypothetical protein
MPSITDLFFVALLGLLVFTTLSVRLLGDAGIGWHIRTGQLILASHAIPRVDPFSATMSGQAWFAWEWLYDVLVGARDCGGVRVDLPAAAAARHKYSGGVASGVAGGLGSDDSFSSPAARGELVIHAGVVLDSGFVGDKFFGL